MASRFTVLIVALLLGYSFLVFKLYDLELVKGGYYTARAQSEVLASAEVDANRGGIYFTDKDGGTLPAAIDKDFPIIYAVPKEILDADEAANALAPILNIPVANLTNIFSKPNDEYESLMKKADPAVAQAVQDLNIKGIYTDTAPSRFYPLGPVASQLLGYVGPNANSTGESGHYGIEEFYNDTLAGISSGTNAGVGVDVTLTIDPNIQIEAEKILDNLIVANGATGGSVIVEDPQTGKILAMGASPSFDPNNYASSSIANFLNPVTQEVYEPGSMFKVLTMSAGIDAGKITPDTTYDDKGTVIVSGAKITNYDLDTHGAYGVGTTMTNVIEHSINTGAVFAEGQTGNAIFTSYLKKFGLGEKTGIDLLGEVGGNLSQLAPNAPQVAFSTAAYGQGVAVTPLEIIDAVAAIANGGVLMRPYINATLQPQEIRRVISTSTAAQVTGMMVDAVDLAQVANINGYSLAGKTGSAFIPDLVHGGYTDKLIDSYVGFGPTSDPQFIALIRIDTLPSSAIAALSVVPAFRDLSQYIINYYGIPPDRTTKDVIPNCRNLVCP
jgi:cell division protein FtsI/penicillin-binding protein 2